MEVFRSLLSLFLDHEVEHDRHSAAGIAPAAVFVLVLVNALAGHGPVVAVQVELYLLFGVVDVEVVSELVLSLGLEFAVGEVV